MNDIHSLSHSKWNCKYHIVFAPKYRRKVFYETKRLEIGQILRQLCNWYGAINEHINTVFVKMHKQIRQLPPKGQTCPHHLERSRK